VLPANATPSAARKVPLAGRRVPTGAPFDDAFVALELDPVRVPVGVCEEDADVFVVGVEVAARIFPMEDVVVHEDVAGAGCAAGVAGSPWKNVEVPYTPIGAPESPAHWSNPVP